MRLVIWILLAVLVGGRSRLVLCADIGEAVPGSAAGRGGAAGPDGQPQADLPAVEKAQLVEFLDFECEACRAIHPFVEELKQEFGDRITFVNRYFPLSSHPNSGPAALAVEAAAQQGKYEAMSAKMFETQEQWMGRRNPRHRCSGPSPKNLAWTWPRTTQPWPTRKQGTDPGRHRRRHGPGRDGTPTFFLNGEKLTLNTKQEFRQKLLDAVK